MRPPSFGCTPPRARLPAFLAVHPAATTPVALNGTRVFDGTGGPVRGQATVMIEDGRVTEVTDDAGAVPDAARMIDVAGRTVMTRLVDVHPPVDDRAQQPRADAAKGAEPVDDGIRRHLVVATLRRSLRMGVTTIRDDGAYGDVVLQARQAMRHGAFTGRGC